MTLTGLNNEQYIISRELGRGGEGTVYELRSHSGLVLKKYNETLTADKIDKLRLMVAMRSPGIEAYAAWPVDLVRDDTGFFCGFVMRKLSGYVPLHMVFSPMDRKKMFPDKGYNFLVHVARNLATAFHKLHETGLVVGDVNEGNILISTSGLIGFIDCDSFQVKNGSNYYYCEVGVPRYTPPELLRKGSFERVVRTVNTDDFSLAVLIFQLLFLGRHPFAGRNKSAGDIDEETAIRLHYFAYSLEKKSKLSPPADSFAITNLPDDLIDLFHHAFEQDDRPLPSDWVKALDSLLSNMVTCSNARLHTYPAKLEECPWCQFRKTRGIMFFLDDSYLQASAVLGDIESFVNGFRIDKLELKKWYSRPFAVIPSAAPIAKEFLRFARLKKYLRYGVVTIPILGVLATQQMKFIPTLILIAAIIIVLAFILLSNLGMVKKFKNELAQRKKTHQTNRDKLTLLIREYDAPSDLPAYHKKLEALQRLVHEFRRLPEQFDRLKKLMEEKLYNAQLEEYLCQFRIESHAIPAIGPAKKTALLNQGIRTASDIVKLPVIKVPGIGPGNLQVLMSWRRQMSSGFVYIPNDYQVSLNLQQVNEDVAKIKLQLESSIRLEYQAVNFLRLNITNRANILETQIMELSLRTAQAKADLEAFEQLAA